MRGRTGIAALLLLGLPGCSTLSSGAAAVVPSSFVSRDLCLDLDRLCWGPYEPKTKTFYLEVKENALHKFECFSLKCPGILKQADEHVQSQGWCPGGHRWDDPAWSRGVFRMTGRCT